MLDFDYPFSVQQLLEPSLPQLVECLSISGTSMATLQIFVELCSWRPGPFTEHVTRLKSIIEQQPHCLALALQVGDEPFCLTAWNVSLYFCALFSFYPKMFYFIIFLPSVNIDF